MYNVKRFFIFFKKSLKSILSLCPNSPRSEGISAKLTCGAGLVGKKYFFLNLLNI